jgi:spore coat polysaccharide biosynthesis protein SpsF (cytidylyltransferase family)
MENYIVINGRKAELTPEQLKALGIVTETKSPFKRVERNGTYYAIAGTGMIDEYIDYNFEAGKNYYNVANYCTDREIMEQRALHETLNRLLWRYSMEHGGREIDWSNGSENKYYVYYNSKLGKWYANYITFCYEVCTPHFHTKEIAENAIKEIIEPFMEQHPDFKF